MIHPIFNIEMDLCSIRFNDVMVAVDDLIEKERPEFITPEHVLAVIVEQEEFENVCNVLGVNLEEMKAELTEYLNDIDKIPEDEEYMPILSSEMIRMIAMVKRSWENMNSDRDLEIVTSRSSDEMVMEAFNKKLESTKSRTYPFVVADLIAKMLHLRSSFAQYLVVKYLEKDHENWYSRMLDAYPSITEKRLMEREERNNRINKLNKASNDTFDKIMGALKSLGGNVESATIHIAQGSPEALGQMGQMGQQKKKGQEEPWKQFVEDITDTWMRRPLIGREKELKRAMRVLCRRDKNNPIFIGEPGVGKTAIVYGLGKMIAENDQTHDLTGCHIYSLNMATVVAGASYNGEVERRMKMVLDGIKKSYGDIVYIDEIHTIMGSGNNGNNNVSDILKPYLDDGSIRFIGTTTYQDYKKSIANNKALSRRFELIDVKEPSVDETIQIFEGLKLKYELHHHVTYTDEAIRYAVEKSELINDRHLPDKAIDILDEAGAVLHLEPQLNKKGEPKARRYQKVGMEHVKNVLIDVCRIDAKALSSSNNEDLKNLDKNIGKQIYGQDEAIKQVVRSVMMAKAGLGEPDKPLASLLFVGPTGVGKTEVCKVLAQELGVQMVRFDMSEYTEKHTVSKLIGSPAGYVGYDEGGLLTDAIRKTPNCVLLLDEIEKAHSDIYNILLQVMDYASLTDNKGNKADFKNVILIMTSNAGAQFASQASVGFGGGSSKGTAMLDTVKKTFKPEFLNRLSGTVVFNDMDEHMASLILDKKLGQLSKRLASKQVKMTLTKEAHDFLLKKGFTKLYGAREMDRVIQQNLTPLLMESILFGKLKKGGDVTVELDGDKLALK